MIYLISSPQIAYNIRCTTNHKHTENESMNIFVKKFIMITVFTAYTVL